MKLIKSIQKLFFCLALIGLLGGNGLALHSGIQDSLEKEVSFDTEEEIEAVSTRRAEVRIARISKDSPTLNLVFIDLTFSEVQPIFAVSSLYLKHRSLLI